MARATSLTPISGSFVRTSMTPVDVALPVRGAGVLVVAIASAALVTASLVFLVWVKMSQVQVGYDIHRLQTELVRLRQEKSALEVEVTALRRPERLARIGATRLGLKAPRATQLLRLPVAAAGGAR